MFEKKVEPEKLRALLSKNGSALLRDINGSVDFSKVRQEPILDNVGLIIFYTELLGKVEASEASQPEEDVFWKMVDVFVRAI